jgi:hypothetical protein
VVNAQRILELADYIAKQPEENFGMHSWMCGTVACIGGHCQLMQLQKAGRAYSDFEQALDDETVLRAPVYLGLTEEEWSDLFMPMTPKADFGAPVGTRQYVTKKRAVATLRLLAKTGKVQWT